MKISELISVYENRIRYLSSLRIEYEYKGDILELEKIDDSLLESTNTLEKLKQVN